MRQTVFGVGILTMLAWATTGAQRSSSPLDAPTTLRLPVTLPTCGMHAALAALAVTSRVPIGFEEASECRDEIATLDVSRPELSSGQMTVREVLDQFVALSPRYRWSEMNGVAVVRPAESRTDPANALNTHIEPFRIDNAIVSDVLALILNAPREHGSLSNRVFSMTFSGGTMVDALNALVQARQGVVWHAHYFVLHLPSSGDDLTSSGDDRWLRVSVQAFSSGDSTEGKRTSGLETRMIRVSHFRASR